MNCWSWRADEVEIIRSLDNNAAQLDMHSCKENGNQEREELHTQSSCSNNNLLIQNKEAKRQRGKEADF